jgi:hypothetical protein
MKRKTTLLDTGCQTFINKELELVVGASVKKLIFVFAASLLVLCFSSSLTVNASQTFVLEPNNKQIVSLDLNHGDFVNGTVIVSGGDSNEIRLQVEDPNGANILSYYYTAYANFSFSANTTGTYQLTLDNSFCSCNTAKNVTIDYTVNNAHVDSASIVAPVSTPVPTPTLGSVFGLPTVTAFAAIGIGVIVMVVIGAGVYLVVKSRKKRVERASFY